MDRVWVIPEDRHAEIGEMYQKEQWSNLVWVYNHFKIGGPSVRLCDCSGSWDKMKIVFEKFGEIYATSGDNEVGTV